MASLVCVSGPSEGIYLPLGKRTVVIGRDEGVVMQIVDDRVSRRHVQIRFDETKSKFIVLDMKSANGTYVNGRRIVNEVDLIDGDEIQIGMSKLVFGAADYTDGKSALEAYKQRGHKARSTIEQR